jgi:hypothetical protein
MMARIHVPLRVAHGRHPRRHHACNRSTRHLGAPDGPAPGLRPKRQCRLRCDPLHPVVGLLHSPSPMRALALYYDCLRRLRLTRYDVDYRLAASQQPTPTHTSLLGLPVRTWFRASASLCVSEGGVPYSETPSSSSHDYQPY